MEDKSLMVKSPNRILLRSEPKILHEDLLDPDPSEIKEASSFALSGRFRTTMQQLDDVERSNTKSERPLPVDLGLDQIEDYQE